MGAIQGSINNMIGTAAGVATIGRHFSNQSKEIALKEKFGNELAGKTDFSQLNAEQAFIKSNEALVGELSKKRAGLLRTKRMLEVTGK